MNQGIFKIRMKTNKGFEQKLAAITEACYL